MSPDDFANLLRDCRSGNAGARSRIEQIFEPLVRDVLARAQQRLNISPKLDRKTVSCAMTCLFVLLRRTPEDDFLQLDYQSLGHWLIAKVFRIGNPSLTPLQRLELQSARFTRMIRFRRGRRRMGGWSIRRIRRPVEPVGGDWDRCELDGSGRLWVLVCDVTGHGYPAYLISRVMAEIWRYFSTQRLACTTPAEVLSLMHDQLEGVLPEDMHVEAVLCLVDASDRVQIAGAGIAIVREGSDSKLDHCILGGGRLGLHWDPDGDTVGPRDIHPPAEVVLSSDGLFELFLQCYGRREVPTQHFPLDAAQNGHDDSLLHGCLERALRAALKNRSIDLELDDITIVTVAFSSSETPRQT